MAIIKPRKRPQKTARQRLHDRWDHVVFTWAAYSLRRKALILGAPVLVVAALVSGICYTTWKSQTSLNGDGLRALKNVQAHVNRHYVLPQTETPALATVTDAAKLTSPIFKNAQTGDKVLIYQSNRLVILYRPSIDRIIAVGPVEIDTPKGGTPNK